METIKNTLYRFITISKIIILSLLLSDCKTYQYYKIEKCEQTIKINHLLNYHYLDNNKWILIELNPYQRDYKNEIINSSFLYKMEIQNGSFNIQKLSIEDRDDYPFKPISVKTIKKDNNILVYFLNMGFYNQRSIEKYVMKKDRLMFEKRFRSRNFIKLIDFLPINEDHFLLINYHDFFNIKNTFFVYQNQSLSEININLKKILKIRNLDNIFLFQTEKKTIYTSNLQLTYLESKNFDYYPIDIFLIENTYYILLLENFDNYFEKNISKRNKINNTFIYKISKTNFNKLKNITKFNKEVEVIKIEKQLQLDNIIYLNPSLRKILLSSTQTHTQFCDIPVDLASK